MQNVFDGVRLLFQASAQSVNEILRSDRASGLIAQRAVQPMQPRQPKGGTSNPGGFAALY